MIKQKILDGAEILDAYRVIPRLILMLYGLFVYQIAMWFIGLPEPTTQQASFASIIFTTIPVIVGFYNNTGRKWGNDKE